MHRLWGVAAVLLWTGCLKEKVQYCNNGALCPEPLVCTENAVEPFCGDRDMVGQCMGKPDETACVFPGEPNGYCVASVCTRCDPDLAFCKYDVWTVMRPGTTAELQGVWAASPTDVYAVGRNGAFVRWNGRAWSAFPGVASDAVYESIWGFGPNEIYVATVGPINNTRVFKYDGAGWVPQLPAPVNAPNAVGGASPTSIFVVGANGEVGRYNGAWAYTTPTASSLFGVWATDANNAVAVGNAGAAIRYASGTWTSDPTGTTHLFKDVAGAGGVEFAVGRAQVKAPVVVKHEGTTWTNMTVPSLGAVELYGVWAISPTDVYAVGEAGTILNYDGASWTAMPNNVGALLHEVTATTNDVFVVGAAGTVLRLSR